MSEAPQRPQLMKAAALKELFAALKRAGYRVIGPTVNKHGEPGAIVLAELASAADLPYGWGVTLEPGGYRLRERADSAAFGHAAGPQSWKPFLHPPRSRLWAARRGSAGSKTASKTGSKARLESDFELVGDTAGEEETPRYAFLGVRPCDLRAIFIQDRILGGGAHPGSRYAARRSAAFIVAVNCTEPGETCFCSSMGTGPQAGPGYDLALTELTGQGKHEFLVETGSPKGAEILSEVTHEEARDATVTRARQEVTDAAGRMGRSMPTDGLRDLIAASYGAARWEDVAARCLTCGNCTMVCPTCFCTTVEDTTDLAGTHAERWELWDSCFDPNFSYLHGGNVRVSAESRYRQWLTHKLGTWHDQFGSSGCVGCGRCIVWCPVGIDITEEVAALRAEADSAGPGPAGPGPAGPGSAGPGPAGPGPDGLSGSDRAEER